MSSHLNYQNSNQEILKSQGKVRVTDLLSRLNEEKKIEKKKKFSFRRSSCFCSHGFWDHFNNLNTLKLAIFKRTKLMI